MFTILTVVVFFYNHQITMSSIHVDNKDVCVTTGRAVTRDIEANKAVRSAQFVCIDFDPKAEKL